VLAEPAPASHRGRGTRRAASAGAGGTQERMQKVGRGSWRSMRGAVASCVHGCERGGEGGGGSGLGIGFTGRLRRRKVVLDDARGRISGVRVFGYHP